MALPQSVPLTVEDLEAMPDDGHRYELVDGTLIVTPAPLVLHQRTVLKLAALLLTAAGDDLDVLPAPFDYQVSETTLLQPDIIVLRRQDLRGGRLAGAPLLVIEVHSPSTRLVDLGTKRLAFEAAGVPAYWVVDPRVPSLTAV